MQGVYFDELEVGRKLTSARRTLTEADVVFFTGLTGMLNPLFTDDIFAQEKGFGTRIAPGLLTVCLAIGLTDDITYYTASAALEIDKIKFISPVRPGDTIWVPEKPARDLWRLFLEIMTVAGQDSTIYLLLNSLGG